MLLHFFLELIRTALLGTLIGVELGAVDIVLEGFDTRSIPETGLQRRNAGAFVLTVV